MIFICNNANLLTSLAGNPLIPNRNEDLCHSADLYDPSKPIFAASFAADGSKLPHPAMDIENLRNLGIVSSVTKTNFRVCLECRDLEYQSGSSDDFCRRASTVWVDFCDRLGRTTENWIPADIEILVKYHFIPVRRFKAGTMSYRDGIIAEHSSRINLAPCTEHNSKNPSIS